MIAYTVNNHHRKTLEAIFSEPVSRNIAWRRIESLLIAVNCEMIEGSWVSGGLQKRYTSR